MISQLALADVSVRELDIIPLSGMLNVGSPLHEADGSRFSSDYR